MLLAAAAAGTVGLVGLISWRQWARSQQVHCLKVGMTAAGLCCLAMAMKGVKPLSLCAGACGRRSSCRHHRHRMGREGAPACTLRRLAPPQLPSLHFTSPIITKSA